jgi:hypothetical protein
MAYTEYKVIQANNKDQLQQELTKHGSEGWKPILLNTEIGGDGLVIIAILEKG